MQPGPDEIRAQLDRVLASDTFAGAGRLSRFLRFVVEQDLAGQGDRLKEYVIGVDVFDRGDTYDPRMDSIVRVEAGRLRAKVEEYYNREGRDDAVVIRMPKGGYTPVFERRETSAPPVADAPGPPARRRWWMPGAAAAALVIVGLAAWRAAPWATNTTPAPAITIAVLPFNHFSTDEAERLLAERITDGVTTELARLGTLGVVSSTSARQYAGVRRPLREVARALNAQLVMEASLFHEGGHIRVEARIVDARSDRKVWVGEFTAGVDDVRDLQRRIATAAAAMPWQRPASSRRRRAS